MKYLTVVIFRPALSLGLLLCLCWPAAAQSATGRIHVTNLSTDPGARIALYPPQADSPIGFADMNSGEAQWLGGDENVQADSNWGLQVGNADIVPLSSLLPNAWQDGHWEVAIFGADKHLSVGEPTALVVEWLPEPVTVSVDMVVVGQAPVVVPLKPGAHKLRLTAGEEYLPRSEDFTLKPGETLGLDFQLQRSALGLYRDAQASLKQGKTEEAAKLLDQADQVPGKKISEVSFLQGLLAERRKDLPAAEGYYLTWLKIHATSSNGQYHLGKVRDQLGQTALAATAFKTAILSASPTATSLLASAGAPTSARVAELASKADLTSSLQLAYLRELRGELPQARDGYRRIYEQLVSAGSVDLDACEAVNVAWPAE